MREQEKFEVTDNENDADLLILNTCPSEKSTRKGISSGRPLKMRGANPDVRSRSGVVASQEGENLRKRAPDVDIVLDRSPYIASQNFTEKNLRLVEATDISFPKLEKFDLIPKSDSTDASAFVSVMAAINTVRFAWFRKPGPRGIQVGPRYFG